MEKKVTITYGEFNETFGTYGMCHQITISEKDADALKEILTRNGYSIVNF